MWNSIKTESWGRLHPVETKAAFPVVRSDLPLPLKNGIKLIPYGQGRSYGDAPLNTGEHTLVSSRLNRVLHYNRTDGIITCQAGITLHDLLDVVIRDGWFLHSTPGTRFVSVGGCLAADVHGKNHHHAGCFSNHVIEFNLLLADGTEITCSPTSNSNIFHATAGGMGLTGLITSVSLQLKPIESTWVTCETVNTKSLKETMTVLSAKDDTWFSTAAWINCTAWGDELGKGQVLLGRPSTQQELNTVEISDYYQVPPNPYFTFPVEPPVSFVNPLTTKLFNTAFTLKNISRTHRIDLIPGYAHYHPLDIIHRWNRLYGPSGFIQYQFVIPFGRDYDVISYVLKKCLKEGHPSSLAVLKRMGEGNGWLSFPIPGWTLALDIAVRPGLLELLDHFDRLITAQGGRVYLAKDARVNPRLFRKMYPEYDKWLEVKRQIDPACRWSSNLSRRLEIDNDVIG